MAGKNRTAGPVVPQLRDKVTVRPGIFVIARGAFLAMRPVQWTKNLLLFLPLAFAVEERWSVDDTGVLSDLLLRALAGAIIFCALSGAVYIVNDIFDRERDRQHPAKSRRPIASGDLPLAAAEIVAVVLVSLALAGGFLLDTGFGVVSAVFVVLNIGYSSFLKRLIILEIMVVGAGYLLRAVAGALIIGVDVSPWLYTTIGLGALFIVLGKRYSELRAAGSNAGIQRLVLDQYSPTFLGQLITITGTSTLVAYALYTFTASNVPDNHSMMLTLPFVVFGLFRYLYLVNQTGETESPELVIIKDKPLAAAVLLWAATAIITLAVNR